MRTILYLPLTFTAALVACGNRPNVWLVEVDTTKGEGVVCEEQQTENIIAPFAPEIESTGPFTQTSMRTGPNFLFYVKLLDLDDGEGSLNSGELLLPGKEDADGSWTYAWTATDAEEYTLTHESGFRRTTQGSEDATTKIKLSFDSSSEGSGSFTVVNRSSYTTAESDLWSDEVADALGRGGTLYWQTEDGVEQNEFDRTDCEAEICEISQTSSCTVTAPLTARRTELKDDDDFSSLVGLIAYGSFKTTEGDAWGGQDSGWDRFDTGW